MFEDKSFLQKSGIACRISKQKKFNKMCFFFINVCCVLVFYVFLCCSVCWIWYQSFCHVALKLDISTLFTTFFLWTSLQCLLSLYYTVSWNLCVIIWKWHRWFYFLNSRDLPRNPYRIIPGRSWVLPILLSHDSSVHRKITRWKT